MKHNFFIAVILIAVTLFITNINDHNASGVSIPVELDIAEQLAEEISSLPNGNMLTRRFWNIHTVYRLAGEDAGTEAPTPAPAPTPTAFSVTPLEPPTTMWATQQVNYRDGADTTYNKVGQLKQHDQITVVGIASMNWYQFSLDGGATYVYTSNNYFTDVDPSNHSVIIDNPETESSTTDEFSEADSSAMDMTMEQLEEEAESESVEVIEEISTEVTANTEEVVETEAVTETIAESSEIQLYQTTKEELPGTVKLTDENTEEASTATTPISETVSQLSWTHLITSIILIEIIIIAIVTITKYSNKK